ncbi:CDK-activating kinase assembly factor MAT1 isoform X2 [Macrobrachium rosenbergii]|uniref:CDK-activating kinase assembly factor MAT1 isoform X2 n=1 Tax=Macrobrachium rosenbergii TaxID=79674 RepID=UPI0034D576CA
MQDSLAFKLVPALANVGSIRGTVTYTPMYTCHHLGIISKRQMFESWSGEMRFPCITLFREYRMTEYYYDASYEIQCPACKGTKYRNPQMKLMVNICGHPLCDACVRMYFLKESAQCPECGIVLKRSKFRVQVFEDPLVEKEIDIRRKVMKIYNKFEEDFETTAEYDDYLEEIEQIVYNLTNDVNRLETEKKMESYERINKDQIRRNYGKKSKGEEEILRQLDLENVIIEERKKSLAEEENREKNLRQRNKTSLIQELMASEGDAKAILEDHNKRLEEEKQQEDKDREREQLAKAQRALKAKEFTSGVKIGFAQMMNAPVNTRKEERYVYEPPTLPFSLSTPSWDELETGGYLNHVRRASPQANAGGYTEHYACLRALQDFMGSYNIPASSATS